MQEIWIGSGWKMNHLMKAATLYAFLLRAYMLSHKPGVQVFIIPPYTVLNRVSQILRGTGVALGAQNIHWEDRGAYTGEVSPLMAKDCGATLAEIGHSERRRLFNETDEKVNLKVKAAIRNSLQPIVCIGDTTEEKIQATSRQSIAWQVKAALHGVTEDGCKKIVFAYEPVWAIGVNGQPAEPDYINGVHVWIREQIAEVFGLEIAKSIPVIYGGSVNLENAAAILSQPEVNGLFIGRAAWKAEGLIRIIEAINAETISKKQQ